MTLGSLLAEVPLWECRGDVDAVEVRGLSYEARRVRPGDVFCTWQGARTDGHEFCGEAEVQGAAALVVERWPEGGAGVPVVRVPGGRRALARLAAGFYGHPGRALQLAGVTGTNGKTSTAYLLHHLLEAGGKRTGLIGTVECRIGGERLELERTTPEALEMQELLARMRDAGCGCAVMEVSSHALDQGRVEGLGFAAAVFTNLTRDHLDYHGDMESYYRAKQRLFLDGMSVWGVVNVDDPHGRRLVLECRERELPVSTFGLSSDADYRAKEVVCGREGSRFRWITPRGTVEVELPWVGAFNVMNALGAAAAAVCLGAGTVQEVAGWMRQAPPVPGRMERVGGGDGSFTVLVDYAHTPDALANVLAALRPLAEGRLLALAGCGGDRDRGKRPLMARAACEGAEVAVFTADNPRSEDPGAILAEMTAGVAGLGNYRVIADRAEAIAWILAEARAGDIVLLAGKGHERTQEIGGQRHPFHDVEVARALLERRGA